MTDQEHDVEDLIAALRDDLPSRDDERRVRAGLATAGVVVGSLATLTELGSAAASTTAAAGNAVTSGGASVGVATAGSAATGAANSLSIAAGSSAVQGGGLALVFAKATALGGGTKVALIAALAVGVGYPAVSQLLPTSEPVPVPAAPPPARTQLPQPSLSQPTLPEPRRPTAAATRGNAAPEAAEETGSRAIEQAPGRAAVRTRAVPVSPARRATGSLESDREAAPVEAVPVEAAPRNSALEAETRLIEQALRAVRAGDRGQARAWLSEHQRLYPNGALAPERQRALEQLQH